MARRVLLLCLALSALRVASAAAWTSVCDNGLDPCITYCTVYDDSGRVIRLYQIYRCPPA